MRIDILTLFPEMVKAVLNESIIGRAIKEGRVEVNVINYRDFSKDKHKRVDDYPFGGGRGMVIGIQPIYDCLNSLDLTDAKILLTSPQGKVFTQQKAEELSNEKHIVIISGHYEGIDYRVTEHLIHEEISVGDYVLTGGELPALIIVDAVTRLIPGVLPDDATTGDSFSMGLLEYPQYTRPKEFLGWEVPEILLSGNHQQIAKYRIKEALRNTYLKRPDLLENYQLNKEEKQLLEEIISEEQEKIKKKNS